MGATICGFALGLPALAAVQALAPGKTDAMAPVRQFVEGFNKGDLKSAVAACAEEASVIDDFPPHVWQGSGCGKWAIAYDDFAQQQGIADARIDLGQPRHVDISGERAYITVPVTLNYKVKGSPKKLPGMFTASLRKDAGGWRITAWAWTDL